MDSMRRCQELKYKRRWIAARRALAKHQAATFDHSSEEDNDKVLNEGNNSCKVNSALSEKDKSQDPESVSEEAPDDSFMHTESDLEVNISSHESEWDIIDNHITVESDSESEQENSTEKCF